MLLFRQSNVLAPYWLFWKEPLFYYYLLTAQLEVLIFYGLSSHSWTFIFKSLVCNDTILTSSGSARGGVQGSAFRRATQAAGDRTALTKSHTNDLNRIYRKHWGRL